MNEKPSKWKVFTAGIIRENPVLRLVLGCCSALAVTTTVSGAVGMGLAMTFVLICSNIVISALRKVIPAKVHLPCYIVIIATFVTVVQMVLQAFVPALYKSLGVYLALIVVNCIILGRAEMFACKNTVVDSALDGLGMGIGYILTMLLMSSIREIIGNGTWLGITIIPDSVDKMTVMNSAPGGFFVFGCLMAGCVWLERKLNKPIERKSCGDVMLEKIDAAKEEQKGALRNECTYRNLCHDLLQHDPGQQLRPGSVPGHLPVPGRFQKAGFLRRHGRGRYRCYGHCHCRYLPHADPAAG